MSFWAGRRLFAAVDRTAYQAENPEQYHGTNDRGDKTADDAAGGNAEESEDPSAENAADDADNEVYDEAETASAHQLACHEAGKNTDDDEPEKTNVTGA